MKYTIALVMPAGSGKTTFHSIIPGVYDALSMISNQEEFSQKRREARQTRNLHEFERYLVEQIQTQLTDDVHVILFHNARLADKLGLLVEATIIPDLETWTTMNSSKSSMKYETALDDYQSACRTGRNSRIVFGIDGIRAALERYVSEVVEHRSLNC